MQYAPINENCMMYSSKVPVSSDRELNSVNRLLSTFSKNNNNCSYYNGSNIQSCIQGFKKEGDICVTDANSKDFGTNIKSYSDNLDNIINMDISCLRSYIEKLKTDLNNLSNVTIPNERSNARNELLNYNNELIKCNGYIASNIKILNDASNISKSLPNKYNQISILENSKYNELSRELDKKNNNCIDKNFYTFKSDFSGRCMEVSFNAAADERPFQFPCQNTINQFWSYNNGMIKNAQNSNFCLQVRNNANHNDALTTIWSNCKGTPNQLWDYTDRKELRPKHAQNMCLDLFYNNKISLWNCHGGDNQKWTMNIVGDKLRAKNAATIPPIKPTIPLFYEHCWYTGNFFSLDVGDYSLELLKSISSLQNFNMSPNKVISSVKVPPGYIVKLYSDDFQQGRILTLTRDNDCLVNNNFNDATTSVSISRHINK